MIREITQEHNSEKSITQRRAETFLTVEILLTFSLSLV